MFRTIHGNIGNVLMKIFGVFPIQKKVVLRSFYGVYCNDNPKLIFEEMRKKAPDYQYVWLMQNEHAQIPGARVVKNGSVKALFELATAKCWIDNSRKREWCVKRPGQYYVQTWHAGIGLKAAEGAAEKQIIEELGQKYIDSAKNDSKMADLFLANSDWMESDFREHYWYDGKILKIGLPREDTLFQKHDTFHKKICDFYNVPVQTKFVLYAPTFRANGTLEPYTLDYTQLVRALKTITGENWKIIVRLHPNIKSQQLGIAYNDDILNGTEYSEINDLILASEYVISDYSSCLFEGMLAGDKVIIYASDIEEYAHERGYLFDFNELPFSITKSTEELIDLLKTFDEKTYKERVNLFKSKLGLVPGGNASAKVADYILEQIM